MNDCRDCKHRSWIWLDWVFTNVCRLHECGPLPPSCWVVRCGRADCPDFARKPWWRFWR